MSNEFKTSTGMKCWSCCTTTDVHAEGCKEGKREADERERAAYEAAFPNGPDLLKMSVDPMQAGFDIWEAARAALLAERTAQAERIAVLESDLAWHKESLSRHVGKLEAVWAEYNAYRAATPAQTSGDAPDPEWPAGEQEAYRLGYRAAAKQTSGADWTEADQREQDHLDSLAEDDKAAMVKTSGADVREQETDAWKTLAMLKSQTREQALEEAAELASRSLYGPRARHELVAAIRALKSTAAQPPLTMGVGDGTGKLFVHGDHESIMACQALADDAGKWRAAQSVAADVRLRDIEQYRMQMAAISTTSLGYWTEAESIHPDYDTVPLRDVAKLYAKYAELHAIVHSTAAAAASESIAPMRPSGMLTDEADEFVELMQNWRHASIGDQAREAFDALVAYINAWAAALVEGDGVVHSYRMKLADGTFDNWKDCSAEHAAHVMTGEFAEGFETRTLYTRPAPAPAGETDLSAAIFALMPEDGDSTQFVCGFIQGRNEAAAIARQFVPLDQAALLAGVQALCVSAEQEWTRHGGNLREWEKGWIGGQLHIVDMYTSVDKAAIAQAREFTRKLHIPAAALVSASAMPSGASVPGWKLVPVEPTPSMLLAAGYRASAVGASTTGHEAYRAMLAAAPAPQGEDKPGEACYWCDGKGRTPVWMGKDKICEACGGTQ